MNSSRFAGVLLPAFLCCILAAGNASAEWTGSGELGLVIASGNTDTKTLNTELRLAYTRERWNNASRFSFFRSETDSDVDASRFVFNNNTNYSLSDMSYLTGVVRYDRDRFSSFEYQTSLALGYGRKLIDTERQGLSVEAGPGVRFSEIRDTGDTETDLIGRAALDYRFAISETASLTNRALVETGSSNTFVENETALTVDINDSLAVKTGFSVRHNTDVERGRDKTDYLSTVNLIYSFGKAEE